MTRVLDLTVLAGVTSGDTVKLPSGREVPVHPLTFRSHGIWQQLEAAGANQGNAPEDGQIRALLADALPTATPEEIDGLNPLQILLIARVAGGAGDAAQALVKSWLDLHPPPSGGATATPPAPRRRRSPRGSRSVSRSS